MNKVLYAEMVLQVGSLQFMECKSGTFAFGRPIYYWKFKDSTTYYGPFNSLIDCGADVDYMMRIPPAQAKAQAAGTVEEQPVTGNNVIKVDFRTKKRIP